MFHVKHLERILPGYTNGPGELPWSWDYLHQDLVRGTVANSTPTLKTKMAQNFNVPPRVVLVIWGLGNYQNSPDSQESNCTLGHNRRGAE